MKKIICISVSIIAVVCTVCCGMFAINGSNSVSSAAVSEVGSSIGEAVSTTAPQNTARTVRTAASVPSVRSMKVYTSANCSSRNSVGNDWSYSFTVNGRTVYSGETFSLRQGDTVKVSATVIEDDSVPDVGTGKSSKVISARDIENGFSISFSVPVTENRGKYSGNTANWNITFRFE